MRVESMSSRLDFDERRARALEGVVMYRPGAAVPLQPPATGEPRSGESSGDPSERRTRRRRRRPRRRPGERDGRPGGAPGETEAGGEGGEAPEQEPGPVRSEPLGADTSSDS
jgi:hypothetical protein